MKAYTKYLNDNDKAAQFVRFIINGILSAAIHYAVYYLCQFFIEVNTSYAIGYIVSFIVNYFTTTYFTFRSQPTWKHFIGFCGSHGVNFGLHILLVLHAAKRKPLHCAHNSDGNCNDSTVHHTALRVQAKESLTHN